MTEQLARTLLCNVLIEALHASIVTHHVKLVLGISKMRLLVTAARETELLLYPQSNGLQ
jgi:hypothetical protein